MAKSEAKTVQLNVRLSPQTAEAVERVAEHWHASQTGVVEAGIHMLANRELGAILGEEFGSIEQSLSAWAEMIERGSADNDKMFTRPEWNYLADVNNGMSPVVFTSSRSSPGTHIWANAEDGHKLDGTGLKWFQAKKADQAVKELVDKVRGLNFVRAWAVAIAIQFFWDHPQEIDHQKDDWWTVAFRRGVVAR